jgi:hypothetical protein
VSAYIPTRVRHLLGILIRRSLDRRFIELTQRQYVLTVLQRFGYEKCNPTATPMTHDFPTRAQAESLLATEEEMSKYPYLQAIGSLMYLMVCTHPGLAYPISVLSQYSSKYTKYHWDGIIKVFRYLQSTKDLALRYDGEDSNALHGYSDSDWGGDKETRRSTTGYTFLMAGAAICWKSRRQVTVAGSTVEAEYMALADATKEALWLRSFLGELKVIDLDLPTRILVDNEGSIHLAKNPLLSDRSKHIDIRHHFIREKLINWRSISHIVLPVI